MALFKEYDGQRLNSVQIIRKITNEMYYNEGIQSFYRGFVPAIFLSTYGVIQMYSYEILTHLSGYESGRI